MVFNFALTLPLKKEIKVNTTRKIVISKSKNNITKTSNGGLLSHLFQLIYLIYEKIGKFFYFYIKSLPFWGKPFLVRFKQNYALPSEPNTSIRSSTDAWIALTPSAKNLRGSKSFFLSYSASFAS